MVGLHFHRVLLHLYRGKWVKKLKCLVIFNILFKCDFETTLHCGDNKCFSWIYCAILVSLVLTGVQTEILCFVGLRILAQKGHFPMTDGLQMRTMKMSTPCSKLIMSLRTKYFQTLSLPQIQDKMKPKSSENQVTPIMTKILKITLKLLLFR